MNEQNLTWVALAILCIVLAVGLVLIAGPHWAWNGVLP